MSYYNPHILLDIISRKMTEDCDREIMEYINRKEEEEMNKEELKTLSKKKYIYHVHCHSNLGELLNIEHYPIIYINAKYVYFKIPGKYELERRYINEIKDNIKEIDFTRLTYGYLNEYLWDIDPEITDLYVRGLHTKTVDAIYELVRERAYEIQLEKYKKELKYADEKRNIYDKEFRSIETKIEKLKMKHESDCEVESE